MIRKKYLTENKKYQYYYNINIILINKNIIIINSHELQKERKKKEILWCMNWH